MPRSLLPAISLAVLCAACSSSESSWTRPASDASIEVSDSSVFDAAGLEAESSAEADASAEIDASAENDASAEADSDAAPLEAAVDSQPDAVAQESGAGEGGASADAAGPACPAGLLCAGSPPFNSKIGLWYTLWWRTDAGGHWDEWSRYVPLIGKYTSGAVTTFPQEQAELEAMKADFLLLDHTNGFGADGGALATAGHQIVSRLESSGSGLRQAVGLGACFWLSGVADRPACMAQESDAIWTGHANPAVHPSAFQRSGRPLLVNYTSPGAYDDWSDVRFTMGAATGRSSEASANQLAQGLWGWVFDDPTPQSDVVMGVTPGWDTQHLGRPTVPLPREDNGMRFQRQWLRAIHQNPASIIVSSWNDFAEETAIQPAKRSDGTAPLWQDSYGNECPSFYYEIAKVYSMMRWGLLIGAYVKDESSPEVYEVKPNGLVYQGAMPVCHPAVNVPAGYLDAFAKVSP